LSNQNGGSFFSISSPILLFSCSKNKIATSCVDTKIKIPTTIIETTKSKSIFISPLVL